MKDHSLFIPRPSRQVRRNIPSGLDDSALASRARESARWHRRRLHHLLVHSLLSAGILVAVVAARHGGFRPADLLYPASSALTLTAVWMYWSSYRLGSRGLLPYVIFGSALLSFHGGQAFLAVIGLGSFDLLDNLVSPEHVIAAISLSALGLLGFHFGALVAVRAPAAVPTPCPPGRRKAARVVGWGLLALSAAPALVSASSVLRAVVEGGYSELYRRGATTGWLAAPQVLATFLIPGFLFLLAGSRERSLSRAGSVVVAAGFIALQFWVGLRSAAVPPLVAIIWLWHEAVRRFRFRQMTALVVGALLLVLAFPVIAGLRNLTGVDRVSGATIREAYQATENPFAASLHEMGGTLLTVAYTESLVPSERSYDMGESYVYALLTLMPNFFWDLHPAIAHGTASDWLVWRVDPIQAARGGGLGYSCIGEAYLNFGWFGPPLVMALLGFGFVRLGEWGTSSTDPTRAAVVAVILAVTLRFARDESASVIRSVAWGALLPYAMTWIRPRASRPTGRSLSTDAVVSGLTAVPAMSGPRTRGTQRLRPDSKP